MIHSLGDFLDVRSALLALNPSHPFYAVRFSIIQKRVNQFLELFPGQTMYAVKCNNAPSILNAIYRSGVSCFDTASLSEIAMIKNFFPNARCFFMHPAKHRADIRIAYHCFGVRDFVVDSEQELEKIFQELGTDLRIFIRFKPAQYQASFMLSDKFGASPELTIQLLKYVNQNKARAALAFHVGSQCSYPNAFRDAIFLARNILDNAATEIDILDIGGGFPVRYSDNHSPDLKDFFQVIVESKTQAAFNHVEFICEPGRALVAESTSVVLQVILRKQDFLYLNEGPCHSFYEEPMGGLKYPMKVIRLNGKVSENVSYFTLFGPTCDNTDVFSKKYSLPNDVSEGDWLEIFQAGAYSYSMMRTFNGFTTDSMVTVHDCGYCEV